MRTREAHHHQDNQTPHFDERLAQENNVVNCVQHREDEEVTVLVHSCVREEGLHSLQDHLTVLKERNKSSS